MTSPSKTISVGLAGSTERTRLMAESLTADPVFQIVWTLTPPPQPIGRQQIMTTNPVELWSQAQGIPVVHVQTKLDAEVETQVMALNTNQPIDILLVVDFGYLVPDWLLKLPKIAPLNIHPSDLPRWRGSSPAQFCLLFGDSTSAVTLMIMSAGLDEGPIIATLPIAVDPTWTSIDYYRESFALMATRLPDLVKQFAAQPVSTSQPATSPTPIAKRLNKTDSFIEWPILAAAAGLLPPDGIAASSNLLAEVNAETADWPTVLERATRAFSPWPGLWTLLPTAKGDQRLKILATHLDHGRLVLDTVQLEGKQPSSWAQLKSVWQRN